MQYIIPIPKFGNGLSRSQMSKVIPAHPCNDSMSIENVFSIMKKRLEVVPTRTNALIPIENVFAFLNSFNF